MDWPTEQDFAADPYSAAMTGVCYAIRLGMDNAGAMGEGEHANLQDLALFIADQDPDAVRGAFGDEAN